MLGVATLLLAAIQTPPGVPDPATAVQHVDDCLTATRADAVDRTNLEARGWMSMNMRSTDGSPLPTVAYARRDDMSFLSASTASAKSVQCVVMIPTHGRARAEALHNALSERFGRKPTGAMTSQVIWSTDGYRIVARPMGNAADPSGLNIEVSPEQK